MSDQTQSLSIGKLAKRAGMTVRALRFYETEGLLSPIRRPGSGHRHYLKADIERVQQIVVLKSIGLTLAAIKELLRKSPPEMKQVLDMQKSMLESRQRENNQSLSLLYRALKHAETGEVPDIDLLCELIRIEKMKAEKHPMTEVARDYFTPDQMDQVQSRATPPQQMEHIHKLWTEIIAEAEHMIASKTDPASLDAQDLAARWALLGEMFTLGDPSLKTSLGRMYEDRERWQSRANAPFTPVVQDFVRKAQLARNARRELQ